MYQNLSALAKSTTCSFELLQRSHLDWLNSSDKDRQDFIDIRKNLVKKMGGCYLEGYDALKMHTSGMTNGAKKTYYWGPSWKPHHDFFEWLKFQPYNFQLLLYIKPTPKIESVQIMTSPILKDMSYTIAINPNKIDQHVKDVKTFINNRPTVFWLMPTYAKLLIDRKFDFSLFPPESNYIYSTGEPTVPEVKEYFVSRGYHYIDAMRSWMGGATFTTCQYGETHWIKMLADVQHGKDNELIVTDLFNLAQPFINYETTDYIKWVNGSRCKCGLENNHIEFIERDVKLPIGGDIIPFFNIFNSLNNILSDSIPNPLLFCSFGYHEKSESLFVLYEVKQKVSVKREHLYEFVQKNRLKVSKIYALNWYQANLFKVSKIFNVSDKEADELKRSAMMSV